MDINSDSKEIINSKRREFVFSDEDQIKLNNMRVEFVNKFPKNKIKNLSLDEYFPGLGKKEGCLGYELEWNTRELGSIKGGSKYKFGYEENFDKIKEILLKLLGFEDNISSFYNDDGSLKSKIKNICEESLSIKGFKTGRVVIGKLLSMYYPKTFVNIFNDQEYLLKKILIDYSPKSSGLGLFLDNNYLLIKIKKELIDENFKRNITNDFLVRFLYFCFPKDKDKIISSLEEERIDAVERDHYQPLIHRNFKKLFGEELVYIDPDIQNENHGHYNTQEVGEIDFLCLDKSNDFVVIELKRSSSDKTVGQICRYMGWVKENLCKEKQKVKGIIIAETKDVKLNYAIKVVPDVEYRTIKLNVKIEKEQ